MPSQSLLNWLRAAPSSPPSESDSPGPALLIPAIFLLLPVALLFIIAKRSASASPVNYQNAVRQAMQPLPSRISYGLLSINVGVKQPLPLTVVTWTRRAQLSSFQGETNAQNDIWVTVAPWLKHFCQDYMKPQSANRERLTLRLEQRLGLPAHSGKDSFVELTIPDARDTSNFFRPCGDPSPEPTSCPVAQVKEFEAIKGDPKQVQSWYWFLRQYDSSFASPQQYPWTSLGYTFDWAPSEQNPNEFSRLGESEFVIPKGAPIQFESATDTLAYCTP